MELESENSHLHRQLSLRGLPSQSQRPLITCMPQSLRVLQVVRTTSVGLRARGHRLP